MRRLLAAALLVAAASSASAADSVREDVQAAVARGDRAAAVKRLEMELADAAGDRARSVEAARAAADVLNGPEGGLLAAKILVKTLKADAGNEADARLVAAELRVRWRDADLPAHQELLRGLAEIYVEDEAAIRKELARSYRHAGLAAEARQEFARVQAIAPADADARYALAALNEELGEFTKAIAVYDELIGGAKPEFRAHHQKTALQLGVLHDLSAARASLDAAEAAARAAPAGPERQRALEGFERLRGDLEYAERRRRSLHALGDHLDAALVWTAAAWAALLGGGLVWLRRKDLI